MKSLDVIFEEYLSSSLNVVEGKPVRQKVVGGQATKVEIEIKKTLPNFFETAISQSGRDLSDFKVYGSVGQPNRFFVKIPWVAVLDRNITSSTKHGYYIVLLFLEDMSGCFLSLNQGYTEFETIYGIADLAVEKLRECALRAQPYISVPEGFIRGVIHLTASSDFGKGYENGAIVSKFYPRDIPLTDEKLAYDLNLLLDIYSDLKKAIGKDLAVLLPPISEEEFQEAALQSSHKPEDYIAPAPGPIPRPPKIPGQTKCGYRRNPKTSGAAMKLSNYFCEIDTAHKTFISKASKNNFVEAHHLIPMGAQDNFKVSLDVPENIVALCPNCHRKLHHGVWSERVSLISALLEKRAKGLKGRAIYMVMSDLQEHYKKSIEE